MISEISPLRRVPKSLPHEKRVLVDSIRYSIEIAALAQDRLLKTVGDAIAQMRSNSVAKIPVAMFPTLYADAWTIVDSIHRLQMLLPNVPKLQKTTAFQRFKQCTHGFKALRNQVQHLNTDLKRLAHANTPVWGVLSWVTFVDQNTIEAYFALSGALAGGTTPPFTLPEKMSAPIDHVELGLEDASARLSEAMRTLPPIVAEVEKWLAPKEPVTDDNTYGHDELLCIRIGSTPPAEPPKSAE